MSVITFQDELSGKALVDQLRLDEPDVPIISHSQLMSWDRCELQWYLSYVEKWKERETKRYMELGKLGHECLAVYYSTRSRELVQAKLIEHYEMYAGQDSALTMLAEESWLIMRYIDDYARSADADLEVLAIEEHFLIPLYTPQGRKYYLQGYVDVRGVRNGKMEVWDHKFSGKFWNPNEVLMDIQIPLYVAAYAENGIPVHVAVVNQLNTYEYKDKSKVKPDQLFRREPNYLSDSEIKNIIWEVGLAVDDMLDSKGRTVRRRMRRDCSMCKYQDPCLMGRKGMDIHDILPVRFRRDGDEEQEYIDDAELNIHL